MLKLQKLTRRTMEFDLLCVPDTITITIAITHTHTHTPRHAARGTVESPRHSRRRVALWSVVEQRHA